VPEEGGGGDVDGEVEGFPEAAAEADAEIGGDHHDGDYVEGYGADGVFEGLAGEMDGVEEIADAELRGFVEEENDGMENGQGEGGVAGEVVQAEIVEAAVRPLADGAVAEGHQGAEEHVEGDGSYGGEADVGGEVQDGWHWVVGRAGGRKGNAREARKNINTEGTELEHRGQRAQSWSTEVTEKRGD
jgi:hypothetical protein